MNKEQIIWHINLHKNEIARLKKKKQTEEVLETIYYCQCELTIWQKDLEELNK